MCAPSETFFLEKHVGMNAKSDSRSVFDGHSSDFFLSEYRVGHGPALPVRMCCQGIRKASESMPGAYHVFILDMSGYDRRRPHAPKS